MGQLDDLSREYRESTDRAYWLAEQVPGDRFTKAPAPGKWSVAECMEHLNLTTRAYLPKLDAGMAEMRARNLKGGEPYKLGLVPKFFVFLLEPPSRLKLTAGAPFKPVEIGDPSRVMKDYEELNGRWLQFLADSRGLAIDKIQIVAPFADNLRYNLYAGAVLTVTHQRRHLWQAQKAVDAVHAQA